MSGLNNRGGIPDLSRRGEIVIVERRIVVPAAVTIMPNGLGVDHCHCHVQLVEIMSGRMTLVPMTRAMTRLVAEGAQQAYDNFDQTHGDGGQ